MTKEREEAIAFFKDMNECTYGNVEHIQMAIKALEQEPCILDDAREDFMYDVYNTLDFLPTNNEANRIIDSFDRVTSDLETTRKKGKWINKSLKSDCGITFAISKCTCCGKNTFFDCDELLYRYCPNCGAEMEDEE